MQILVPKEQDDVQRYLVVAAPAKGAKIVFTSGWWNGIHAGLRSLYRKVCGFKSHPGHLVSWALGAKEAHHATNVEIVGSNPLGPVLVNIFISKTLGDCYETMVSNFPLSFNSSC